MLRDPNRYRRHAQNGPGLLRRHTDGNPQDEQLALGRRKLSQQGAGELRIAAAYDVVLRSGRVVGPILQLAVKLRRTRRGPLGVGHLVCSDTEDERLERAAFVTVAR